jgi:hypothetical protein
VKLFYNQNVYDWLEGYTGEYGAGYIYKRKINRLLDIFTIWGKEKQTTLPKGYGSQLVRPGTLKTDTVKAREVKTDTLRATERK